MMRQLRRSVGYAVLVVLLSCASAWAQATAAISGTARDQSGAVLPGVTITATQQETGGVRTTVSSETGSYSLLNLPLGPWRVEAMLPGFNTFTQPVVLQVGTSAVINPVMGIGAVAEQISVTGTAPVVDTKTVGVSTVVESQRIVELPLNARQVTQLVSLSGAAVQTGANAGGPYSVQTGVPIAVAGSPPSSVGYYLDGAPHLDQMNGLGLHLPFPDALQEFRFTTGAQDAGANIRSAASVNAVTKSGTNTLHGDAFEFLRDARFSSPDPFSLKKDALKRNQFGGTVGGPIMQDKLFFFAGVQGTTTRQFPINNISFVPTAAMRAGDFTAFAAPACNNGRQLTLNGFTVVRNEANQIVSQTISPSLLSPAALNISRRLPTPIDECGKVLFGVPNNRNEYQVPVRVDYQVNSNHSLLFRYMLTRDDRTIPFAAANNNLLATGTPGSDDRSHYITGGHTWVLNQSMVNSFRGFGNVVNTNHAAPNFFSPQDVGMNSFTYNPGLTFIAVQGAFTLGQAAFGSGTTKIQNQGFSDDFTVLKGAHQFSFGGYYLWNKTDVNIVTFGAGNYTFNGQTSTNALADFMLGRMGGNGRMSTPGRIPLNQTMAAVFASDSWKLQNLTLNYGVVWNPFMPPQNFGGGGYTFDRAAFLAGTKSTAVPIAPAGFAYPGDAGFSGTSGMKSHLAGFDPRVGFAWDVTGDGRTALRGGAGLSHDYLSHATYFNNQVVSPYALTVALATAGGGSFDNPWATFPGGNPFPYTFNPNNAALAFPAYTSFLPFPPDLKPTRQYSWNLAVQRQITDRWSASATYLGNRIVNALLMEEQNPALNLGFGPCTLYDANRNADVLYPTCTAATNVNQRRALNVNQSNPLIPNPAHTALGYLTQYTDRGYTHYNGMLLATRLDVSSLWNVNANYTRSKCEGTLPLLAQVNLGASTLRTRFENNPESSGVPAPGDLTLEEGPCPADRKHLFNLTSVFRTPEFGGVLGALVSNWSASSVLQMRSGSPINVTTGSDIALNGISDNAATQRPNVVAGADPYGDRDSLTGYLNFNAFTQPAPGTYGNSGLNSLRGPGFWQWDQSFVRGFNLSDRHQVELRVEAINVTNRANYSNPGSALNNAATFGRITSVAGTPRVWQFAVKYTF